MLTSDRIEEILALIFKQYFKKYCKNSEIFKKKILLALTMFLIKFRNLIYLQYRFHD